LLVASDLEIERIPPPWPGNVERVVPHTAVVAERKDMLKTILDVIWRDAGMVDGNLYDLSHN
jgi:hypothetical protein